MLFVRDLGSAYGTSVNGFFHQPGRLAVRRPNTATSKAPPMIDHRIGNVSPPRRIPRSSGRPRLRPTQLPSSAPSKPTATETRQPPREKPVRALATLPQTPAITRSTRNSTIVMIDSLIERCRGSFMPTRRRRPRTSSPRPANDWTAGLADVRNGRGFLRRLVLLHLGSDSRRSLGFRLFFQGEMIRPLV